MCRKKELKMTVRAVPEGRFPQPADAVFPVPETGGLAPLAVPIPEAGRLLSISARTAWTLCDEGKLRSFKIGTRRLVAVKEIERFLADSTAAAATEQRGK
jgi:hypothetical protein